MSERIIEVSKSLWLKRDIVHPDYDDGLFYIYDDAGDKTLIDIAEIPALIEALNAIAAVKWEVSA